MTDGTALREIAAEILTEILEKGQYTHLALFQALSKYQYLEKADRSFLKRIVDGTGMRADGSNPVGFFIAKNGILGRFGQF